jgi:hypothetical protein
MPVERSALRLLCKARSVLGRLELGLVRVFCLILALSLIGEPVNAQTTTNYVLYTGQAGAQTQIDARHKSSWVITTNSSVPTGTVFWGGQFTMKRGSGTTQPISLSFYEGASSAGVLLAQVTLIPSAFGTSFTNTNFQLTSPVTLDNNKTYYAELTSAAPDVQSEAYFLRA